jgi:hypothetical protein
LKWTQIPLFQVGKKQLDRDIRKSGYRTKVKRAVLLSALAFKCDGTICVADADTAPEDCREQMQQGLAEGLEKVGSGYVAAYGMAFQSVDAWTLGACSAVAEELGVEVGALRPYYPSKPIEELSNQSGKEEHQPKTILERICSSCGRFADTAFRTAVAERTEIGELEKECPRGFKPFTTEVRRAFGTLLG